jgi:hypothetical protein
MKSLVPLKSVKASQGQGTSQGTSQISPQLQAIVDLHANQALASFVQELTPLGLETTQMALSVLQQVEESCWRELGRRLERDELLGALDALIRDPSTRHHIVQLYQESKQPRLRAPTIVWEESTVPLDATPMHE